MNIRLKNAMLHAHVDIEAVTRATDVDPKTVQRWLKGRIPHARHRWKIANLLNISEYELWPVEQEETPFTVSEIVKAYGRRSDAPVSAWWQLFVQAHEQIDLLAYAMLFLPEQHTRFADLLKEKADSGCKIRIALADPTCPAVQLRDAEEGLNGTLPARIHTTLYHFRSLRHYAGIDIKYHSTILYNSVFRGDNDLFVTPHLYRLHGSKAPLFHVRHAHGDDGVFASFMRHFETVWEEAITIP